MPPLAHTDTGSQEYIEIVIKKSTRLTFLSYCSKNTTIYHFQYLIAACIFYVYYIWNIHKCKTKFIRCITWSAGQACLGYLKKMKKCADFYHYGWLHFLCNAAAGILKWIHWALFVAACSVVNQDPIMRLGQFCDVCARCMKLGSLIFSHTHMYKESNYYRASRKARTIAPASRASSHYIVWVIDGQSHCLPATFWYHNNNRERTVEFLNFALSRSVCVCRRWESVVVVRGKKPISCGERERKWQNCN